VRSLLVTGGTLLAGIERRRDALPWIMASAGRWQRGAVSARAVRRTDVSTLYAGTDGSGIFRSDDGG
jgi:hypothetical protein